MQNRLAGALALGLVVGLVTSLVAGAAAGAGAFAATGVMGAILLLWRSHRDRTELERALVPVPIRRIVRDDVPMRGRR